MEIKALNNGSLPNPHKATASSRLIIRATSRTSRTVIPRSQVKITNSLLVISKIISSLLVISKTIRHINTRPMKHLPNTHLQRLSRGTINQPILLSHKITAITTKPSVLIHPSHLSHKTMGITTQPSVLTPPSHLKRLRKMTILLLLQGRLHLTTKTRLLLNLVVLLILTIPTLKTVA